MDGTRLLERIRQMTMDQGQRKGKDRPSLEASVLEHLSKLLNTRQGSTIISSDYGVPDMSVMTATPSAENVARIEEILTTVVERFEPRLTDVKVVFAPSADDPLKMSFSLQGTLAGQGQDAAVFFQTVLSPSGRISIQRARESA
ncbi:MAG: type VI secretion system baseplate subunit TssE [Desulfovibrio sp.]|nr:type VI secretion system baseplate subunit TssE [Desulfovibrio sp.]